jgi:hypothetical protein
LVNRAKQYNRVQCEVGGACYPGCDVVIQAAVWAGEDVEFLAQIKDVCRKGRKSYKKDNEKKCFPFMKQSRGSHEWLSSSMRIEDNRIKSLVKNYSPKVVWFIRYCLPFDMLDTRQN